MGLDFPTLKLEAPARQGQPNQKKWGQRLIASGSCLIVRVLSFGRPWVLLHSAYFPRKVELQLAKKSHGIILPWLAAPYVLPASEVQPDLRARLENLNLGSGEFETCLARMLVDEIPLSLLEDFKAYSEAAQRYYPKSVTALCSANSWYYDETFKHACVRLQAQGVQLLGIQHGGNYGSLELMLGEDHEIAITDRYYTWGWSKSKLKTNVWPMPAAKLIENPTPNIAIYSESEKSDILWVATSATRYLSTYPFVPEDFSEYLKNQQRFISCLAPKIIRRLRLRPHYEDNNLNQVKNIKVLCPDLSIETWTEPFKKSLIRCRLYICDHLSTTFLEALALNKPTLLFWCPKHNKVRKEADAQYQQLHQVGILHYTPESAAETLSVIANNIEGWWSAPERQTVVRDFCQQFALASDNSINVWVDQFKTILQTKVR
jgi:putative transferase (TIGR04331 family)